MEKTVLIFFILFSGNLVAQNHYIYQLDKRLRKGNIDALYEIGNYFDSKTEIIEFLGHHLINTNESNVAKRLVRENSMFMDSEIIIDSTTTKEEFSNFLSINKNEIKFSKLANAFLITSFDKRETNFEIIELTDFKWNSLNTARNELLNLDWVKKNTIDSFVNSRNPLALLKAASVLLKNRYRFDEHRNNKEEIINLIQLLTKSQIAVPNESRELSYHLDKDFYEQSKINLLIFFANNYKKYKWNDSINAFRNDKLSLKSVDKEKTLFEMLSSENDSIAQNAFISLTRLDLKKVSDLSDQYRKADISENYILPTFSFSFLKQLVHLTNYCKGKNIDFEGNKNLKSQIQLLKTKMTFTERRKLEDELINILTLDNITAFEYWSLIYEKSWSLTYSAGRILDKFYSENWQKLLTNPTYLETYLLKSKLFDDLGIIGFCNNYLLKFRGLSPKAINLIQKSSSTNPKVQEQIKKVIKIARVPVKLKEEDDKDWYGEKKERITNFEKSLSKILKKEKDSSAIEEKISYLLSQIDYNQIGQAIKLIEDIPIDNYHKYSFMVYDFGFSFISKFEEPRNRNAFLKNYSKFDEKQLYTYYSKQAGIDFTQIDDSLDFDKIYEILKYDINTAFVGGGGSTKDNGVYSIIKILELTFDTTLGYPNKLCCSNNMYACDSRSRAIAWMKFLEEKNYLKTKHNEPVSFAFPFE